MYYIKKIFRMLLSVFSIGTFSFLLLELIPGDPETTILGLEASAKDLENLREQLGLNLYSLFSWYLYLYLFFYTILRVKELKR